MNVRAGLRLTLSLPRCHLKTTNKKTNARHLKPFLFSLFFFATGVCVCVFVSPYKLCPLWIINPFCFFSTYTQHSAYVCLINVPVFNFAGRGNVRTVICIRLQRAAGGGIVLTGEAQAVHKGFRVSTALTS